VKILTVVGARPQFIKAGVVSRKLCKNAHEIIVHTGQHYDSNMSDVFFRELEIPTPDYNLNISGGSHASMTGRMLIELEKVMLEEKPDKVLVYGDTNSTLAAALAATKIHIPVAHVEAGARLGTLSNPEEVNRILTDHMSTHLMACTESALDFLEKEGLMDRTTLVGDPMYDAFCYYSKRLPSNIFENIVDLYGKSVSISDDFYYLTCHRQENTEKEETLISILDAMEQLDAPTYYPVHPRNQKVVKYIIQNKNYQNIKFIIPVGYSTSIAFVKNAKRIVTDSGGVQREAFFAQKPCVTVFDYVVWPETMKGNWNQLSKPDTNEIINKLKTTPDPLHNYQPFGDGNSAEKIIDVLLS